MLERFVKAQEKTYAAALAELITLGKKVLAIDEDAGRAVARGDRIDDAEEADLG